MGATVQVSCRYGLNFENAFVRRVSAGTSLYRNGGPLPKQCDTQCSWWAISVLAVGVK